MNSVSKTREEKKEVLHRNYKKNMDRFKRALGDNYQIEALLIIFAVFEQTTNNLIVRISSLSEKNHLDILDAVQNNELNNISKKIRWIQHYIRDNIEEILSILKESGKVEELKSSLKDLNKYRTCRNVIVHDLMLSDVSYEGLKDINIKCLDIFRVLDKTNKAIKRFINANGIDLDVSDVSLALDKK
ncbi:MAG: hypothetical protein IJG67_02280 [Oscillospiraceae bacterium]|nr:hypothetical protein [Oscillospiraceae bacterium]